MLIDTRAGLPRATIGHEHNGLRLFKACGGAVGAAVGAGVGAADSFVRGAVADACTMPGWKHAALTGLAVGACAGVALTAVGLPGLGVCSAMLTAAGGGVIGSFAAAGVMAAPAGARAGWARGKDLGVRAASAVVRGETLGLVWLGEHSRALHAIGLAIMKMGMTEPTGRDQQRLHQVDAHVFRSAQPGPDVWKDLAAQGFKSVINLRVETDYEKQPVEDVGLRSFYIPESPMKAPTVDQTLDFLKIVTDPANQPCLFHCYSGVDRTGTMAACYRIAVQGWTQEAALKEALELGMVPELQADKMQFIMEFNRAWQDMKARGVAPVFPQSVP
jgi:protein tyrosine phosphatase (PTP) superfamily phosphohydrolase (DUF442 family)